MVVRSQATLWFMSLVAERPPKFAVGFNPRSAIPPNHLVAERRSNHRHTISDPFHSRRCPPPSIVAPRRIIPVSSFRRGGWVETHGDHPMSLRDGRHLDHERDSIILNSQLVVNYSAA